MLQIITPWATIKNVTKIFSKTSINIKVVHLSKRKEDRDGERRTKRDRSYIENKYNVACTNLNSSLITLNVNKFNHHN
jgi:hypothetical protein